MEKKFFLLAAAIVVLSIALSTTSYMEWAAKAFILFFLGPVAIILFSKQRLSEFGLNNNRLRLSVLYAALLMTISAPILYYFSADSPFSAYYPIWSGQFDFLTAQLVLIPAMLGTEFFFRGFLLNTFVRITRPVYAVLSQSLLYALIHLGKPLPEVPLSLLAGIAFGYVAFRTRSIMPSLLAHFSISVMFDAFVLGYIW
jgi:membrane protease YdiL (CAAX protease family)